MTHQVHTTRGGAVWQLVGLITRRSQVQILPPQPRRRNPFSMFEKGLFVIQSRRDAAFRSHDLRYERVFHPKFLRRQLTLWCSDDNEQCHQPVNSRRQRIVSQCCHVVNGDDVA